jgi:hypothetical protein
MPGDDVLLAVEAHLLTTLGSDSGRASVSFVGVNRIDVLRFGPVDDGRVTYATLGLSRLPMADPAVLAPDTVAGPRAELLLTLDEVRDSVLRGLAVVAATPAVEGLILRPGATVRLGEPLWDGAEVTGFLLGESTAVPELELGCGRDPVRFLSLDPVS